MAKKIVMIKRIVIIPKISKNHNRQLSTPSFDRKISSDKLLIILIPRDWRDQSSNIGYENCMDRRESSPILTVGINRVSVSCLQGGPIIF